MRRHTWMLMFAVLLSACATTATLPGGQKSACVPSGMPPFETWQYVAGRVGAIATESGETVRVVDSRWTVAGRRIQAMMTAEGVLVMVDPDPDNPSTPFWLDTGMAVATARGVILKANGTPACQWVQQKSYASGSGERDVAPDQGGGIQRI